MKRSVQVERALQSLNYGGDFFLFILISTGELNTKWLLHSWTSSDLHAGQHDKSYDETGLP